MHCERSTKGTRVPGVAGPQRGKGLVFQGTNRASVPEKAKVGLGLKGGKRGRASPGRGNHVRRCRTRGFPLTTARRPGREAPALCWGHGLGRSQVQSGGKAPGDPAAFCKTTYNIHA